MPTTHKMPAGMGAALSRFSSRPESVFISDLEQFCALLNKWQPAQNLVSRETLAHFWDRHVLDSLQLAALLSPEERVILDLGSGGGFPALPLAIACQDQDRVFHLVESNRRKVSFLREVARSLSLPAQVHNSRIEELDSRETGPADLITARALAPLSALLGCISPLLRPGGRALLHKGRDYVEEVRKAGTHWQFDVVKIASETETAAVILDIRNIERRSEGS